MHLHIGINMTDICVSQTIRFNLYNVGPIRILRLEFFSCDKNDTYCVGIAILSQKDIV